MRGSTLEVDPRTDIIKIIIMAVDPWHRYSNEAETADIYNDFKFKNSLISMVYTKNISALQGLKSGILPSELLSIILVKFYRKNEN